MSLILDSARFEYVYTNTQPLITKPITISAWIKSTDIINSQAVVCIGNGVDEFLLLQARGAASGDPAAALEYATAWKLAESSSGYTANTWYHIAATFVNATERSIWINGGSKVTNTDNQDVNFALLSQILIGIYKAGSGFYDGQVAEIAIWDKELSDAQISNLANGAKANDIELANLKTYWKLIDNYLSSVEPANTLSVGAGTPSFSSNHPPIDFPGKPTIVSPTPTGVTNITLDETPLEWAAGDPVADTYEIYFREQGDDWELVGVAQAGVTWVIPFGTISYGTTYEWRIDATNAQGTTTGDTWTFSALTFDPPLPTGVTLDAGGEPTGTPTGESNMMTVRKLIVAANDKIWHEDI